MYKILLFFILGSTVALVRPTIYLRICGTVGILLLLISEFIIPFSAPMLMRDFFAAVIICYGAVIIGRMFLLSLKTSYKFVEVSPKIRDFDTWMIMFCSGLFAAIMATSQGFIGYVTRDIIIVPLLVCFFVIVCYFSLGIGLVNDFSAFSEKRYIKLKYVTLVSVLIGGAVYYIVTTISHCFFDPYVVIYLATFIIFIIPRIQRYALTMFMSGASFMITSDVHVSVCIALILIYGDMLIFYLVNNNCFNFIYQFVPVAVVSIFLLILGQLEPSSNISFSYITYIIIIISCCISLWSFIRQKRHSKI